MSLEVLREVGEANAEALEDELKRQFDERYANTLREGIPVEVWRNLAPPLQ